MDSIPMPMFNRGAVTRAGSRYCLCPVPIRMTSGAPAGFCGAAASSRNSMGSSFSSFRPAMARKSDVVMSEAEDTFHSCISPSRAKYTACAYGVSLISMWSSRNAVTVLRAGMDSLCNCTGYSRSQLDDSAKLVFIGWITLVRHLPQATACDRLLTFVALHIPLFRLFDPRTIMTNFPRIERLPPYVFNITGELKMAARRRGEDIIDMSMGNPDGATPKHIVDKLVEAATRPDTHGYSVSKGIPRLRKAISGWYERRYGVQINPDTEAIVTIGSKEGL